MTVPVERFFGWTVVSAAFVIAIFGWGVGFYGPPIYLKAVQDARGWSVALVSAAVTVHFLFGALVVANLPRLHRRFGLASVTLGGAVLLALGVAGWAMATAPWQLFLATLFSGAGWVAMGAAGINAMVSPWFVRRRPAALSMAYNGASVGGVIFSPLWVALIGWGGFPLAAWAVGLVMVSVVVFLARSVLRHTPEGMGVLPDGEVRPAALAANATLAGPALAFPLAGSPWRGSWSARSLLRRSAGKAAVSRMTPAGRSTTTPAGGSGWVWRNVSSLACRNMPPSTKRWIWQAVAVAW